MWGLRFSLPSRFCVSSTANQCWLPEVFRQLILVDYNQCRNQQLCVPPQDVVRRPDMRVFGYSVSLNSSQQVQSSNDNDFNGGSQKKTNKQKKWNKKVLLVLRGPFRAFQPSYDFWDRIVKICTSIFFVFAVYIASFNLICWNVKSCCL